MKEKKILRKGFLSSRGNPTMNALIMYVIYLKNLPIDWNIREIHYPSIEKVRRHFNVNYGFDVMIYWGISIDCGRSKTSKKQHVAMLKAYHDAKGLIGKGYQLGNIPS